MGNCTCSTAKEENATDYMTSYNDDFSSEPVDNVIDDIFFPIRERHHYGVVVYFEDYDNDYDDDVSDFESISDVDRNISFENDSDLLVSNLKNLCVEEELCSICTYSFDEDQHIPRVLPCGHTFCVYCVRKMAKKYNYRFLKCPLDRKRHILKQQHTTAVFRDSSCLFESGPNFDLNNQLDTYGEGYMDFLSEVNTDTTNNAVIEENCLDPVNFHSHFDSLRAESQINEQLTNYHRTSSQYAVQEAYNSSAESDFGESETEIGTALHRNVIQTCDSGINQQPVLMSTFMDSQSLSNEDGDIS